MQYTKQFPTQADAVHYAIGECARYAPIGVRVTVENSTVYVDRGESAGDAADLLVEAAQRLAGLAPRYERLSFAEASKIAAAREAIDTLLEMWDE